MTSLAAAAAAAGPVAPTPAQHLVDRTGPVGSLVIVTGGVPPCHSLPAADDGCWPTCLGVGQDGHLAVGQEALHAVAARLGAPFVLRDSSRQGTDAALVLVLPRDSGGHAGHELPRPGGEGSFVDGDLLVVRIDLP